MKRLILILAMAATVSCIRHNVDEVLLPREDISLTVKGEEQFSYNPLTCQTSHNTGTHEFRAYDDRLSEWFILKCKDMPSNEGQELTADLTWTASSSTKTMNGLTFRIEKIDRTGKVWMWCKKKKIGIVIKNL